MMPSMFTTLRIKPMLGRVLAEDENPVDSPAPVLLISESFWKRHFNRDPNVVGKALRVDGLVKTVIGVMPKNFYLFDDQADSDPDELDAYGNGQHAVRIGHHGAAEAGCLIRQAQAEMESLAAQQAAADPVRNKNLGVKLQSMADAYT